MLNYLIVKTFPEYGLLKVSYVMEEIMYRAIVRVDPTNIDPKNLTVEVWTNQRDIDFPEGDWHSVVLPYRGARNQEHHVYGQISVLVEDGMYEYIFKAKTDCELKGSWYPAEGQFSTLRVEPPRKMVEYASILQVPFFNQIIGPLHVGNESAAMQAKDPNSDFTHLLCVAEELQRPFENMDGLCFCRSPMPFGIKNTLLAEPIWRSVFYTRRNWKEGYKILVYSKHGFGRSGSIAIAFVMAENQSMTYEEALDHVFHKRPVIPHHDLKRVIQRLFPRTP